MCAEFAESVTGVAVELTREPIRRHTAESLAARLNALSQEMAEVSAELALAAEMMVHLPDGERATLMGESHRLGWDAGRVSARAQAMQIAREIDATGNDATRPR